MFQSRKKRYLRIILCLAVLLSIASSYAIWDQLDATTTATITLETQKESSAPVKSKAAVKPEVKGQAASPTKSETDVTQAKEEPRQPSDQGADNSSDPTNSTEE